MIGLIERKVGIVETDAQRIQMNAEIHQQHLSIEWPLLRSDDRSIPTTEELMEIDSRQIWVCDPEDRIDIRKVVIGSLQIDWTRPPVEGSR